MFVTEYEQHCASVKDVVVPGSVSYQVSVNGSHAVKLRAESGSAEGLHFQKRHAI